MASRSMKKTKGNLYNAKGAPEAAEAEDDTAGFKKGGTTKKKKLADGGLASGGAATMRADRAPRAKRAAGGRTPYSSGSSTSMPSEGGKTNSGHEGERPGD